MHPLLIPAYENDIMLPRKDALANRTYCTKCSMLITPTYLRSMFRFGRFVHYKLPGMFVNLTLLDVEQITLLS